MLAKIKYSLGTSFLLLVIAGGRAYGAPSMQCTSLLNEGLNRLEKKQTRDGWRAFINQSGFGACPLSKRFLTYVHFLHPKQSDLDVFELMEFMQAAPNWPKRDELKQALEENISFSPQMAPRIAAWFDAHPPTKGRAIWAYLQALRYLKRTAGLDQKIKKFWVEGEFDAASELLFLKAYHKSLGPKEHQDRVNALLWKKSHPAVVRMLPRLSKTQRLLAESRLYLQQKKAGVDSHVKQAMGYFKDHLGFVYDRLVWRREKKKNQEAAELLKSIRVPHERHTVFWKERHLLARRALEAGKYKEAYDLVAAHGMKSGASFAAAEWLAGWLALRFLNNPAEAQKRFKNLFDNVRTPISKSRAAYWLGRAYEATGQKLKAEHAYGDAARFRTTFYGQLAAHALGLEAKYYIFDAPTPTPQAITTVENREYAKLLILLSTAPRAYDWTRFFAINLAAQAKNDAEKAYTIQFISKWAPNFAVEAARTLSMSKEVYILESYPGLGEQFVIHPALERPFVWALIRRESMFDHKAVSPAGAMGLMQVMPFMAKNIAKKHKIKLSDPKQMILDPALNAQIGSAHLYDLLQKYKGSYPLALAAYNAGEGPVDKWLREFGDPRKGEIEWLDWLELIPYHETRDYVQRVLEQLYIYRVNYPGQIKEHPLTEYAHKRASAK